MAICPHRAWNNFVMRSEPASYEYGSSKRAAALASLFMGLANNGGLNHFLTSSYDFDATEILDALNHLGATKAGHQLEQILQELGDPLPASSQMERWERMERDWSDELEKYDVLLTEADTELLHALEKHVAANKEFYVRLD